MSCLGFEPSLYVIKLVEANIAHIVTSNASHHQKDALVDVSNLSLGKSNQATIIIHHDLTEEPVDTYYFTDTILNINFIKISNQLPEPNGMFAQNLYTTTNFVLTPQPKACHITK